MHTLDYISSSHVNSAGRDNFYSQVDPLEDFTDDQFKQKYRMTKASFNKLLSIIGDKIREESDTNRGRPTSAGRQLLIALRFYAVGTFHDVTGEMAGYSKSHICHHHTSLSHLEFNDQGLCQVSNSRGSIRGMN